MFAIWGSQSNDVWLAGADVGNGPLVFRFDGSGWKRHPTGASGHLWWVSGTAQSIWFSGENGLILRRDRQSDTFEAFPGLATSATLFGIFPFAEDNVWAVGGDANANTGAAFQFDGNSWSAVTDMPATAYDAPLFKIWGSSANDFWVVGLGGEAYHFANGSWTTWPVPAGRRLLTVHGQGTDIAAVGGFASGLVVKLGIGGIADQTPGGIAQMNGIWIPPSGLPLAAGNDGQLWQRFEGDWMPEPGIFETTLDYHAAYVDDLGGRWAVGGKILSEPFNQGLVVYRGPDDVATATVPQ